MLYILIQIQYMQCHNILNTYMLDEYVQGKYDEVAKRKRSRIVPERYEI